MSEVKPKINKLYHPVTKEEYLYPKGYGQSVFNSALSYVAKPTDIFVCSYAKCGTTWLQNITWLIVHNGEEIPGTIRQSMPMLEFDGAEAANNIDDSQFPRIIKTHFPQKWVPYYSQARYLYITRNPKDAFVSYYFHMLGFYKDLFAGLKMETLFNMYINGEVALGYYFDHVVEWHAKREESNVLFLLYEDLKKDIRCNILKIASFLGKEYRDNLLKDDNQLLNRIIELTEFKKMQSKPDKWSREKRPDNMPFIRKGEVGDWRNHLTKDQSETMDRILLEKGQESGVNLLWKDYPNLL